jgi:FAD/FMN-containing dehydrogenase
VRLETVYVGEFEEGVKALAPLFDIAPVKDDNLRAMDFPNINLTSGIGTRGGARHHWTTQHIPAFNEDIINVIVKKAEELRETQAAIRAGSSAEDSRHRIYADHIYFYPYKGEMCRIPEDFNAYGRRDPGWIAQILVAWGEDDERIEERVAWGDAYRDELEPFSYRNGYLNSTIYTGVEQVKLAYGDAKFRKLQRLKAKYDPDNFFNRNFNIPPDANA